MVGVGPSEEAEVPGSLHVVAGGVVADAEPFAYVPIGRAVAGRVGVGIDDGDPREVGPVEAPGAGTVEGSGVAQSLDERICRVERRPVDT